MPGSMREWRSTNLWNAPETLQPGCTIDVWMDPRHPDHNCLDLTTIR